MEMVPSPCVENLETGRCPTGMDFCVELGEEVVRARYIVPLRFDAFQKAWRIQLTFK